MEPSFSDGPKSERLSRAATVRLFVPELPLSEREKNENSVELLVLRRLLQVVDHNHFYGPFALFQS